MTQQLLQQLVEMRGIETQYVDAWENQQPSQSRVKPSCSTR